MIAWICEFQHLESVLFFHLLHLLGFDGIGEVAIEGRLTSDRGQIVLGSALEIFKLVTVIVDRETGLSRRRHPLKFAPSGEALATAQSFGNERFFLR